MVLDIRALFGPSKILLDKLLEKEPEEFLVDLKCGNFKVDYNENYLNIYAEGNDVVPIFFFVRDDMSDNPHWNDIENSDWDKFQEPDYFRKNRMTDSWGASSEALVAYNVDVNIMDIMDEMYRFALRYQSVIG